jgi:hypothetical protein
MTSSLNGRVSRLEATYAPPADLDHCRGCGLLHAEPLPSMEVLRQCLGVLPGQPPRLCLCAPCCGGSRWLARRSHGLPDEGVA